MLSVDIRKAIGTTRIDATFESAGGVTALFGRSGAGKTSLVNMLAGLLRPDSGRIAVNGDVLFDSDAGIDLAPEHRRLGYVFQDARLFPHMTVRANLRYGMSGRRDRSGIAGFDEVVRVLGLESLLDRRPAGLSGGERQRVAIGRALLSHPRLLLMDEPLASLDRARRLEILPFIERLIGEFALPVVYVTHHMGEIVRLADDLAVIDSGRLVAFGPVEEVTSALANAPYFGRQDAGAVMRARVLAYDAETELSELAVGNGRLFTPLLDAPPGAEVRLRIRARDVSLSLQPPVQSSVLNVLQGKIVEIGEREGAQVNVRLDVGTALWARITWRSLRDLEIRQGDTAYALIKAVAVDRQSLGGRI
jgi:molybdate transport system ATP-binding protein